MLCSIVENLGFPIKNIPRKKKSQNEYNNQTDLAITRE
jgi:hypothetical protein